MALRPGMVMSLSSNSTNFLNPLLSDVQRGAILSNSLPDFFLSEVVGKLVVDNTPDQANILLLIILNPIFVIVVAIVAGGSYTGTSACLFHPIFINDNIWK